MAMPTDIDPLCPNSSPTSVFRISYKIVGGGGYLRTHTGSTAL